MTAVQIGDPITQKRMFDFLIRARDKGLYRFITDNGAGGLSSSIGEMAVECGGCRMDLAKAPLKYSGLNPWEILISEAQERMVLAVAPENLPALQELCETFDTELTDIGAFTGQGRIIVRYGAQTVLDLENEFLHEGIPQRQLRAVISERSSVSSPFSQPAAKVDFKQTLLKLLAHPNITSKAHVIRIYDHEVQGGTVIKPLTGVEMDAPSDATVLKPIGTRGTRGIVLSNGINPEYGKLDAYQMTWAVIDEAIRNAVAVGADIIGIHTGIDQQLAGQTPFSDLAALIALGLNVKVSVAGGIKQSTVQQVVQSGPDIIVIGGAITGSKAADVAAREIRDLVDGASGGASGGGLFGWLKSLFS